MVAPIFTIVIPTLNRADVLRSAIATCVLQDDSALQILVSDNASDDDTRKVVDSFADPRIRYVNPGRQLGMPEHWEFALSHVAPGYVSVLGDDDGLLPCIVRRVREILESRGVEAVAWRKAEYHWPDHIVSSYRNWLQVPLVEGVEILESTDVLRDVLAFKRTYADLPCVYNSFVATEALDAIRRRCNGRLLPCITPDMYSGIAIACVVDRYAFSMLPLSVNAASRHSNGTITSFRGVSAQGALQHFTASAEKIHPRLVRCASVPVLIADAVLAARNQLTRAGGWPELDWPAMLEMAARYAEIRPPHVLAETLDALQEIAQRNDLTTVWEAIRATVVHRGLPELQPPGWDSEGKNLVVDGEALGLRDVADAAAFVATVLRANSVNGFRKRLKRSQLSDCLPTNLESGRRLIWAKYLLRLQRPPPPKASKPDTDLRRYLASIRRRLLWLLSHLGIKRAG